MYLSYGKEISQNYKPLLLMDKQLDFYACDFQMFMLSLFDEG